jgi:hypothetical protein
MTKDDQDAEVGRLVRERRDMRAHHEALVSKLQQIGQLLSSVGHALNVRAPGGSHYPQVTLSIDQNGAVNVSDQYHAQSILSGKFPTAGEVQQLLNETKDLQRRLAELNEQLKSFGV